MDDQAQVDWDAAWGGAPSPKSAPKAPTPKAAPQETDAEVIARNLPKGQVTYKTEGQPDVTVAEAPAAPTAVPGSVDWGATWNGEDAAAHAKRAAFQDYASRYPGWNPPAGAENYYSVPKEGDAEPLVTAGKNGPSRPLSDYQAAVVGDLKKAGKYDTNQPQGSKQNPYIADIGGYLPSNRGQWYIPIADPRRDETGKIVNDSAPYGAVQVGDPELVYNKRKQLMETPEGQAALAQARSEIAEQATHKGLNSVSPLSMDAGVFPEWLQDTYASSRERNMRSMGQRRGIDNPYANASYSDQQYADAHFVALREGLAKEEQQNPNYAALSRGQGQALSTLPLAAAGAAAGRATSPALSFLTGSAGEAAPGLGGLALRTASGTTSGALQGGLWGAYQSGGDPTETGRNAFFGGLLGGGLPIAGAAGSATGRAILGAPAVSSAERNLLQTAADQGINLRAGQMSSNPFFRTMDSELGLMPGTGYAKSTTQQHQAFTRAVSNTFGEDAPGLTQEVMDHARKRIGAVFDDVASRTNIPNGVEVANKMGDILKDAASVLPESDVAPLRNQVENIKSTLQPDGSISGASYQAITRRGGPLDRALKSDNSNIRDYAGDIREELDNALEASAQPEDWAALRNARLQWKNMRTVEPLAGKAGPDGVISPPLLKNEVRKSYKDYAYTGTGDSPIGDLAEIGQRYLKEPANSMTASRLAVRNLLTGAGAFGVGEGAAYLTHNPVLGTLGLLGAGATQASPMIAARVLNNPLTRSAFINEAAPGWLQYANGLGVAARPAALPLGLEATNLLLAPPKTMAISPPQ